MTITLLRPDGIPLTAQQHRQGLASLNGGGYGRPLGGRSGFRIDTPSTILTATSTTWTLGPCSAMIDPGATTHQGMYGWATDSNVTGDVTAADSTYIRKDIVYIQINDSSAGDGSGAVSAQVGYLAGTPGDANPPALPVRSFLVGTITVPIAGGGSPTVVLNPARFVAAGAPMPVASAADRPTAPHIGMQVIRADRDNHVQTYTGVGSSGWEYRGNPRRYYADPTTFITTSSQSNKVICTITSHPTRTYATKMRVNGRLTAYCDTYGSGIVRIRVGVSVNQSQAANAQAKANVSWVPPGGYYQNAGAETDWISVVANDSGVPRIWIEHVAGGVNEQATAVASDGHLWVEVLPADD